MPRPIPYGRQQVDDDDVHAVVETLKSDYLTTGPAVTEFENRLATITGAKHVVAVNSGTSALHAMYFAAGIGPGDEIITSPLTFAATANAALYLGATVKFTDVDPDTGNIDPNQAEAAITERTKAIVAIDYAGHPADYDRLRAITDRHGLTLLADAAHSLGATYHGTPVGTLADATELSFHPVKPITTAEGGAVTTNHPTLAKQAARFRTHGITKDPTEFQHGDEGPWWYEQHDLGYNYRLTDLQAALGTSQLRKLGDFIDRRRQIAHTYDQALTDNPHLQRPGRLTATEPGWHLYVIRTNDPTLRRPLFERLRAQGIGVQVHYIPVYWHPYYQQLGYQKGQCPNAEEYYHRAISLPIYPALDDDDLQHVIDTLLTTTQDLV